ncbi:hypothetical protein J5J86_14045 [Aquabacter sp. L1I39]|uniref:GcrA family cell cycle regulator n=1 Tax=Aquabacter sp. L1I39 TaxID=2820278 RepID=UPI001ADA3EDE|nr:GcrA family cell cycle regulator [Aquabacter sp. L1I39]QTL01927.1 hypothetical protein J5J86_14045 [Aquabacter sp. L1I39]
MSVWKDPEALRILRVTAAKGAYVREIVEALQAAGFAVNRNAVIGKAHRAGIALMRPPGRNFDAAHVDAARPVLAAPAPRRQNARILSPAAVPLTPAPERGPRPPLPPPGEVAAATPSPAPAALVPSGPAGGVRLIGLPADRCRWPVSGAGAGLLVCGASADHRAYCRAHGQLAYQPLGSPLRLPADPTVRPVRSRERERSFMDAYGEAV